MPEIERIGDEADEQDRREREQAVRAARDRLADVDEQRGAEDGRDGAQPRKADRFGVEKDRREDERESHC
ncbi:hypothetical protein GCM10011404_16080 [Sphingomonas prati]|nr:hypothetical protein GCM10011404_16080 [Sphingomonas prati]